MGNSPSQPHQSRLREFEDEAAKFPNVSVAVLQNEIEQKTEVDPLFYDLDYDTILERKKKTHEFLLKIKKPVGIFCADDMIAFNIRYTAEVLGLKVPDEVAILGVGSLDKRKKAWARSVSIVQLDHNKFGQTAARLMDEYFKTNQMPRSIRLSPSGVHQSQTTFRRTVDDALIRKAFKLIQEEPSLTTVTLCEKLDVSRATLDVRFRRAANMTVTKAIELERFLQAKQLIRGRNQYSLEAIASLAGYPNRKGMRRSFYRFTRMSPHQYRESNATRDQG